MNLVSSTTGANGSFGLLSSLRYRRAGRIGNRNTTGFTLIEVLLAISITLGMFVIVLYFYHQATNTRTAVLTEVEKVTAARMIMGQLTTELRSAIVDQKGGVGLRGTSTSIRIATLGLPPAVLNLGSSNNPSTLFQTGLKQVSYSSLGVPEMMDDSTGTNAPMEDAASPFADLVPAEVLPSNLTNSLSGQESPPGGIQRTEEPILLSSFISSDTAASAGTNVVQNAIPVATTLLTEHFRYINFRYFNGSAFQSGWNGSTLPMAVEITLSNESLPSNESQSSELPPDYYRRLVYLPGGEPLLSTNRLDTLFIEEAGL